MALSCSKKIIRGTTSKNNGDFCCLNCLYSFRTKSKLESHKRACENTDFCNVNMPTDDTKILEINNTKNLIKHHSLFMQILSV